MKWNRIVLASNNAGKLIELSALMAPLGIELITQASLGIGEADEPFNTFVENALAKARHASRSSGLPALADDSGLSVAALNGAPGVRSARYAQDMEGQPSNAARSDEANNERLQTELAGAQDRSAFYYCVLALVRWPDDPCPLLTEGRWYGQIIEKPRGNKGFGYDPYFWIPAFNQTAAELDPDQKNRISHRGQAIKALIEHLRAEQ